jgi:excisionase family DNA binding protein
MTGLLTTTQAAQRLAITRQAVLYMINDKRINAVWMLERWAIPVTEVTRLRQAAKRAPQRKRGPKPRASAAQTERTPDTA